MFITYSLNFLIFKLSNIEYSPVVLFGISKDHILLRWIGEMVGVLFTHH